MEACLAIPLSNFSSHHHWDAIKQDAAGVRNHGVEEDPETHDKYINFYDPDGIAWELYSISTPFQG
jgi:hypothetical protein